MRIPPIERLKNGKMRFYDDYIFTDSVRGYDADFNRDGFRCALRPDGELTIFAGSVYDMGTGAINTPAMVVASAEHDAGCHMTNYGVLPWAARHEFDKRFFSRLGEEGATISRWWRTAGVMLNSQLIARWRRAK